MMCNDVKNASIDFFKKIGKAAANHPRRQSVPNNFVAKLWKLRNPENKVFIFKNLTHFVRTNPQLFHDDEIVWMNDKNGVKYCLATVGLRSLRPTRKNVKGTWHGWRWISDMETMENDSDCFFIDGIKKSSPALTP